MPGRRIAGLYAYSHRGNESHLQTQPKEGRFFSARILKGRPPVLGGSVDEWNNYIAYLVRLSMQKSAAPHRAAIAVALKLAESYARSARYSAGMREKIQTKAHEVLPISRYIEIPMLRRNVVYEPTPGAGISVITARQAREAARLLENPWASEANPLQEQRPWRQLWHGPIFDSVLVKPKYSVGQTVTLKSNMRQGRVASREQGLSGMCFYEVDLYSAGQYQPAARVTVLESDLM
jgi:hypothetical protein